MDENANRILKMVRRDLSEWYKLWNKLDKHGKKFTKNDLSRLNLLDEKINYYQEIGILEDAGNAAIIKGPIQKIKEALGIGNTNADTLKISFKARDNLNRAYYEQEGIDFDDLRRIRLDYHGDSIVGAILHKIKDWNLEYKINKECKLMQCIFEHNYQNKYDQKFNNRMIELNMENYIKPMAEARTEYWEIIKRNGRLKLNIGLFKIPIIREKIAFDSYDLQDLADLERVRDAYIYPDSIEQETLNLQTKDDDYLEHVKNRSEFLGIIEKENGNDIKVENKVLDLKGYMKAAKDNRVDNTEKAREESPRVVSGIAR